MDETLNDLINILEGSVKKNGKDKVLTLGHLLNILKKIRTMGDIEDPYPFEPNFD